MGGVCGGEDSAHSMASGALCWVTEAPWARGDRLLWPAVASCHDCMVMVIFSPPTGVGVLPWPNHPHTWRGALS